MQQRSKRGGGWVAALVLVVATLGMVPVAAAQGGDEAPTASEVGITGDTINIAVIADSDNAISPGLFQGSADAVEGFAKFINNSCKPKNTCLAGRKLVVDFYDSKLNPNEARNAIIKACENDFAMVGTAAVLLSSIDDQLACVDKAGKETGIPDIPFLATEVFQQCSPITFPVSPPQVLCDTVDQHPQTFQASVGRAFYYKKKYGNDLHGIYLFGNDSKSARISSFASGLGQVREVCCKSDKDFDVSSLAPQAAYTPFAQAMKEENATYAQSGGPFSMMATLRKEAKLQGVNSVKVWDCGTQCYDEKFIEQAGADAEDQYVDTLYLPFHDKRELKANKMLANFVKYTGEEESGQLGAVYSWAAAVAFRDAVNAAVEKSGVNGLTRASLLEALNNIHEFDAEGMYSPVDLAGRKIGPCHVLNQVQDGEFVRIDPTKPGTFDCKKRNVIHVKLDLL